MPSSDHAELLSRRFDATASRYDLMIGLNPGYHRHLRSAAAELMSRLPSDRPLGIADLGCGSGASTAALLRSSGAQRASIVGVDASEGMLAAARGKSWPEGVRFVHGSAGEIAERAGAWGLDAPLDGVLACYLFRNIADRAERTEALRSVRDVLRPGGWLVVQDYSVAGSWRATAIWTLVCWAVVIPLAFVLTGRTALYRYLWRSVLAFDSVGTFEAALANAGFTEISTSTASGWQRGILHTVVARRPS